MGALYVRETFAGESKRMVSAFGPKTASNISERSLKMSLNSSETQILLCCFVFVAYVQHMATFQTPNCIKKKYISFISTDALEELDSMGITCLLYLEFIAGFNTF